MTWKLFLDDERFPVDSSWAIARTPSEAFVLIEKNGMPNEMSLDHDLGEGIPTGYDFVRMLSERLLDGEVILPDSFKYYVHSQNPVGKRNIEEYLNQFLRFYRNEL